MKAIAVKNILSEVADGNANTTYNIIITTSNGHFCYPNDESSTWSVDTKNGILCIEYEGTKWIDTNSIVSIEI